MKEKVYVNNIICSFFSKKSDKLKVIVLTCFVFISSSFFVIDTFEYKTVPKSLIKKSSVPEIRDLIHVEKYLPKGYSNKGDVDYTLYIQEAIDNNSNLIFPNFPILVNDKGLNLRSNSVLVFQENSYIWLKASSKPNYGVINIKDIKNVTLINPRIVGDRDSHLNKIGEWGMGINILNSDYINIFNAIISKCWGDGIYIGNKINGFSSNININGGLIDNNRRNGISIVSGEVVVIKDITVSNTNGTLPMSGIDLEPNTNEDTLKDIKLVNVNSFNNRENGYLIYLGGLLGENKREVDISIESCFDQYSNTVVSIPGLRNDYEKKVKKIAGKIHLKFLSGEGNKFFLAESSGNYLYTPTIIFEGVEMKGNEKSILNSNKFLNEEFKRRSSSNIVIDI
ncbi:right-handed parallel beta-helix repeat-containing protein [Myroides marinus]|nr:right-handed parallel beta-helix repeat-containing protein [Myroides marinus]